MSLQPQETKICTKCRISKPASEFYPHKGRRGGLFSSCKKCNKLYRQAHRKEIKERSHNYYIRNRQKVRERNKQWQQANREKVRVQDIRWREEHPDKWRETWKKSQAKRMGTIRGRLTQIMSNAVRDSLTGRKKSRTWQSLVGYTTEDLKRHIEKRFLPGMSWGNRHLWEIDHIVPLAAFNFQTSDDIDFKRAWNLKNLRPLWKSVNRSKGAKINKPFQPNLLMAGG
jgi:hypothetical protein